MKKLLLFFSIIFLCCTINAQTRGPLYRDVDIVLMDRWVDSVLNTMTMDEKIGQLFMPVAQPDATWKTRVSQYINQQKIGGLLFTKGTMKSQAEMTNYVQQITKTPLLIALDGEWGLSMRLRDAPVFPRNMVLGAIQDEDILKQYGKETARQCKEMGIHVNFAPSLDVHSNPKNPVIGDRAYGENPQQVAKLGIAYAMGLEENGILSVAKHFPGHGDTSEDSHKTLPTIAHNRTRLEEIELTPFRKYIQAGLSGIMLGHLNVPTLHTNGLPASLSPQVGIQLLRDEMGFKGITFTDGMAMQGVANQSDVSVKALLAGNDIILGSVNVSKEFESVKAAVAKGTITKAMLDEKVKRILSYKYLLNVHRFKPINTRALYQRIHTPQTKWLQRKIYEKATVLLKNEQNLIPIKKLDKTKIASVVIGASSKTTFQLWLNKYSDVHSFQVSSPSALATIKNELKSFDLIIFSIHSNNMSDAYALQEEMKNIPSALLFFTKPQRLNRFQNSINAAQSVILCHDNTEDAQISAAQALFGGIAITGKIPVSVNSFKEGAGIETTKTRLSYSLPEEVGIASQKLQGIENIALSGIRQHAYPGCQILIAKNGVVIYDKAFGSFDYGAKSEEVTDETVYDIASMTKASATVPAIMKLYDEKKIRLRDVLSKHVPQTRGSNKANINIRSLLFHESRIPSFIPYYTSAIDSDSYSGKLLSARWTKQHSTRYAGMWARTDYKFIPGYVSTKASASHPHAMAKDMYVGKRLHDKLLKDIIDTDLLKNRHYRYSCLNFMLLKEAIENIAKTDLDSYVKQHFFNKLGATSTTFQPLRYLPIDRIPATENDGFFRKQHIRGYVHDEGAAIFGGISGNAGLFSTANDLAKLYQMWLNQGEYGGERYLKKETVRLFTTSKSNISRRGLGFDKPDPRNSKRSPTSPNTPIATYGHTGYTGTCFWIDPTNQLIYIFLSNRVNPSRSPNRLSSMKIRERVQDEIYRAINSEQAQ